MRLLQSIVALMGPEGAMNVSMLSKGWQQLALSPTWKAFIKKHMSLWFNILPFTQIVPEFKEPPKQNGLPENNTVYITYTPITHSAMLDNVSYKVALANVPKAIDGILGAQEIKEASLRLMDIESDVDDLNQQNVLLSQFIINLKKEAIREALLAEMGVPKSSYIAVFNILAQLKKQGNTDPLNAFRTMLAPHHDWLLIQQCQDPAMAYFFKSNTWLWEKLPWLEQEPPSVFSNIGKNPDELEEYGICLMGPAFAFALLGMGCCFNLIPAAILCTLVGGLLLLAAGLIVPLIASFLCILVPYLLYKVSGTTPESTVQRRGDAYEKMVISPTTDQEKWGIFDKEKQKCTAILKDKLAALQKEQGSAGGLHSLFYNSTRTQEKVEKLQEKMDELKSISDPKAFIVFKEGLLSEKGLTQRRGRIGILPSDTHKQLVAHCVGLN